MVSPPLGVPGQSAILLDADARLEGLLIQTQPKEVPPPGPAIPLAALSPELPPDWSKLFELARLDASKFHAIAPSRGSFALVPTVANASCEGPWPDDADRTLRLHAGARSGRPVYWEIEWKPGRTEAETAALAMPLGGAPDTWFTRLVRRWQEPSLASWRNNALWICAIVLPWRHRTGDVTAATIAAL